MKKSKFAFTLMLLSTFFIYLNRPRAAGNIESRINLFDKTAMITNKEVYYDGSIRTQAASAVTEYIPVNGDDLYVSGLFVYTGLQRYCYFYDADKLPIGSLIFMTTDLTEKHFTIPRGAIYFVMSLYQRKTGDETVNLDSVRIELNVVNSISMPDSHSVSAINAKENNIVPAILSRKKTDGMTGLFFGDSITETASVSDDGATYTEGTRKNWPTYAKTILGLGSMWNYAKSGGNFKDLASLQPRQKLSVQITTAIANRRPADIIVIAMGANSGDTDIGDYTIAMSKSTLSDLDRTKSIEAMRWAFWTLRKAYPNAICFAATPIARASSEAPKGLIEAIYAMGARYNFIVIPAHSESGIVREFEVTGRSGRDLYDGLHPNESGQRKMANLFSRVILNSLNY